MRIMRYLKIALRSYDSFGVSFDFNIKGKKQYQSVFGGILSVLMTFVLLFIFISGLISIMQREKFSINVQQKQSINPEYNEMNISNFMFAIKLEDPFKTVFPNENRTAFSIVVNQVLMTTAENGTRYKTVVSQQNLEQCQDKHFQNVDYDGQESIKNNLNGYLCLPLNFSLKLQGNFNSQIFYYPAIKVSICTTDDCYTSDQIAPYVTNRSFMVTISTIIQSSIYIRNSQNNEIIQTLNSDFFLQTNLLEESKADLFFENNKVLVNNNLLSFQNQFQSQNFWSFSIFNIREFVEYHSSPSTIFSVNFRISQDYEETKKQVNTIDDFLSYFGGLLKVISSIFGIIAFKYNELGLRISVANHLYQFNIPKKVRGKFEFSYDNLLGFIEVQINRVSDLQLKLKNHTRSILQTTKYMKAWVSQKFSNSGANFHQKQATIENNQQIQQFQVDNYVAQLQQYKLNFLQDLVSKISETRHDLRLGFNFLIYELLCCSCFEEAKQTRKMLHKCEKVINQDLDIIHLLKKIQEIDKLKQILLQEEQIHVFDYTPKPVINILPKVQKKQHSVLIHKESLIEKVKQQQKKQANQRRKNGFTAPKNLIEIYQSYSKIKEDSSTLNARIIELLGPTIELIFQNYYSIQKLAQKFSFQESEKLEQIQILTIQKDKQTAQITQIQRRELQSHQFIQISPKYLNTDEDEIKED